VGEVVVTFMPSGRHTFEERRTPRATSTPYGVAMGVSPVCPHGHEGTSQGWRCGERRALGE